MVAKEIGLARPPRHEKGPPRSEGPAIREVRAARMCRCPRLAAGAPPRNRRGAARPVGLVERHRSPHGCVLQAAAGAVTVSWFPASDTDSAHGELVVSVWRGVVSLPGSARRERQGAVMLEAFELSPVEVAPAVWAWRRTDDTILAGDALAACCRTLIEGEMREPRATPA